MVKPRVAAALAVLVGAACSDGGGRTLTLLSGAMEPTLAIDQRVEVEAVEGDEVERGDIVALELPDPDGTDRTYIYRVVGLPGEEVGVADGALTINGQPLEEPWLPGATTPPFFDDGECHPSCVVGSDEIFVLGDNRMNSAASNMLGPVPAAAVSGRVSVDDT